MANSDIATLRITEIFHSLQGESRSIGLPTVFVRLTGCPLRCSYCDTSYAFQGGEIMPLEEIVAQVKNYPASHVTVTGGEPLAQPNCIPLLSMLCDLGYEVSLETSGALPVSDVDPRVSTVLDLKTPASGELDKNDYANLALLDSNDQIKFVICDRLDYEWAKQKLLEIQQQAVPAEVLFSPSFGQQNASELADWIVADGLPVRFQLQLHKILWADEPGR